MDIQTCTIDQYESLRQGFKLTAVIFDGNRQEVASPHEALVLFCTHLIHLKVLTESKLWQVNFSWLRTAWLDMELPQLLPGGFYLESAYDVNGSAPLLRINLLCKRLDMAPSRCVIEYYYENESVPHTSSDECPHDVSAGDYLKECLQSDGLAADMLKTPADFTEAEVGTYVPILIRLGKRRAYWLEGWKGFANWTIAYCLTRMADGFSHLKNLQELPSWQYGQLIDTANATHPMIPVAESCSDLDAFRLALAVLDEVGFDRYSLSLECKKTGKTPQPSADANKPEPHRPSPPPVTLPPADEDSGKGKQPSQVVHVKAFRHLRPVFQIEKRCESKF